MFSPVSSYLWWRPPCPRLTAMAWGWPTWSTASRRHRGPILPAQRACTGHTVSPPTGWHPAMPPPRAWHRCGMPETSSPLHRQRWTSRRCKSRKTLHSLPLYWRWNCFIRSPCPFSLLNWYWHLSLLFFLLSLCHCLFLKWDHTYKWATMCLLKSRQSQAQAGWRAHAHTYTHTSNVPTRSRSVGAGEQICLTVCVYI